MCNSMSMINQVDNGDGRWKEEWKCKCGSSNMTKYTPIKSVPLETFKKEHYDENVVKVFTDLEKYRVKTGCILINENAFMVLKEKHLGKK